MNRSMIRFILGKVLWIEGLLILPVCLTGLIYRETVGLWYLAVAAGAVLLGLAMSRTKPASPVFYLKEGCVTTALSWILMSFVGALPLWLSREIPRFTDAMFEMTSGFTTTGASILTDVEAMSHCALLWRSLSHWIGGMGVLVFLLAVVPLSGGSHMNLMLAESPGPSVGKLVPRVKSTARILYAIYLGLTVLEFVFLLAGRMPVFDSVCTSLGTAGTGGFGIKNDSFAGYSVYLQWVTAIFMVLFGVNFNAYYLILLRQVREAGRMEEVRCYFAIIAAGTAVIFLNILHLCQNAFDALGKAFFQVASVITTTGFATADFDLWPTASKTVLIMLMFVGACAGSTGGGMKVSRYIIMVKTIAKEFGSYIHPKSIKKLKMDGKPIEHEVVRSTNVYFITFFLLFAASVFLVSLEGQDPVTSFTAVVATINNIGPGLAAVGPAANFAGLSVGSKWVLIFDMLAGRLELFPMLILFCPALWRDAHRPRRHTAVRKRDE